MYQSNAAENEWQQVSAASQEQFAGQDDDVDIRHYAGQLEQTQASDEFGDYLCKKLSDMHFLQRTKGSFPELEEEWEVEEMWDNALEQDSTDYTALQEQELETREEALDTDQPLAEVWTGESMIVKQARDHITLFASSVNWVVEQA